MSREPRSLPGKIFGSLFLLLFFVGTVWFSGLLGLDMFVEQLWFARAGGGLDPSQALPFGLIFLLSALLVVPTLTRRSREPATRPFPA